MIYDGTRYFYQLNLQGDVIGLLDTSGASVAKYAYDPWGRLTYSTGSMKDINPLRYRGYYCDNETKLYYVGTRYYDPVLRRFINADSANLITANPYGLTDKNLFSYCDNNPVNRNDDGGEFWHIAVGAVVGAAISATAQIAGNLISGEKLSAGVLGAVATGAASGALAASGVGVIGQVVGNMAISATGDYASQRAKGVSEINWNSVARSSAAGAAAGFIGGAGANKNGVITKCVQYTKKALGKEAGRANAAYAAKKITKEILPYAKRTLGWIAVKTSARMAGGAAYSQWYSRRRSR